MFFSFSHTKERCDIFMIYILRFSTDIMTPNVYHKNLDLFIYRYCKWIFVVHHSSACYQEQHIIFFIQVFILLINFRRKKNENVQYINFWFIYSSKNFWSPYQKFWNMEETALLRECKLAYSWKMHSIQKIPILKQNTNNDG